MNTLFTVDRLTDKTVITAPSSNNKLGYSIILWEDNVVDVDVNFVSYNSYYSIVIASIDREHFITVFRDMVNNTSIKSFKNANAFKKEFNYFRSRRRY